VNRIFVVAFFLLAAIAALVTRWLARSPETSGHLRANYTNSRIPVALRNSVAFAPIYALAGLFLASTAVAPPSLVPWLALASFLSFEIGFVISYRVPAPFLPTWMKREIAEGTLEPARPNRWDRPLLWILVTGFTFAEAVIEPPWVSWRLG
jgi:hypothetical protein